MIAYNVRELSASPAKTHAVLHFQVSCLKVNRTSPRVPEVFLSLQSKWNDGVICSTIHHVCFPLHLNAL